MTSINGKAIDDANCLVGVHLNYQRARAYTQLASAWRDYRQTTRKIKLIKRSASVLRCCLVGCKRLSCDGEVKSLIQLPTPQSHLRDVANEILFALFFGCPRESKGNKSYSAVSADRGRADCERKLRFYFERSRTDLFGKLCDIGLCEVRNEVFLSRLRR